jgi:hypothetical protein
LDCNGWLYFLVMVTAKMDMGARRGMDLAYSSYRRQGNHSCNRQRLLAAWEVCHA